MINREIKLLAVLLMCNGFTTFFLHGSEQENYLLRLPLESKLRTSYIPKRSYVEDINEYLQQVDVTKDPFLVEQLFHEHIVFIRTSKCCGEVEYEEESELYHRLRKAVWYGTRASIFSHKSVDDEMELLLELALGLLDN